MITVALPSLRIGGGVQQAVKLAQALVAEGAPVRILSLWTAPHEVDVGGVQTIRLTRFAPRRLTAPAEYPLVLAAGWRALRRDSPSDALVLTHYSTFPLGSWTRAASFAFVQDLDFAATGRLSTALRTYVVRTYRHARLLPANAFLAAELRHLGFSPYRDLSIWGDEAFRREPLPAASRPHHCAMVLRRGAAKRLDLYRAFLSECDERDGVRAAVITPDDELATMARRHRSVSTCLVRPSIQDMAELYRTTRVFLSLSDSEGFGLPPLEAMGSGCVPLCREGAASPVYMVRDLARNVLSAGLSARDIFAVASALWADEARLARLSSSARAVFDEGLASARSSFSELARAMRGDAPPHP